MVRDLTVGKSGRVIFSFCLPLFLSVVFQQIYNIADSFVAGRFIGEDALAAVGNSYEMTLIFIAFAFGCSMGASVLVSRLFGAKEFKRLKTSVTTSISATVFCFILLMVFGLGLGEKILLLINTPLLIIVFTNNYKIFTQNKDYLFLTHSHKFLEKFINSFVEKLSINWNDIVEEIIDELLIQEVYELNSIELDKMKYNELKLTTFADVLQNAPTTKETKFNFLFDSLDEVSAMISDVKNKEMSISKKYNLNI